MYILNIMDRINESLEPLKEWIIKNQGNPILWLGLFGLGLLIFESTYRSLQKEK